MLTATLTGFALVGAGCAGESDEPVANASDTVSATPTAASASESEGSSAASSAPGGNKRSSKNITLAEPAEGAEVSGTFTASGKANSPEANVPWQVQDSSGKVVKEGFATATGWIDKLYPWQTKVDVSSLEPGTYVFAAMTDDPSGGEGKPAEVVKATIVVK